MNLKSIMLSEISKAEKGYIVYNSLYTTNKKMQNYMDRNQISGSLVQGVEGGRRDWLPRGTKELFVVM